MSNQPLVSICIPSYNHEKYIAETIASVILQDYQNIELIIIDDCSTDNSDAVINTFVEQCKTRFVRFEYYKNAENKGISYNLNQAIKWANGKYFYAIASDDILMPFKTSLLVSKIEKLDNRYAAIFGDALLINENSDEIYINESNIYYLKKDLDINGTINCQKLYKTFVEFFSKYRKNIHFNKEFDIEYKDILLGNFLPAMSNLIKLDALIENQCYSTKTCAEDLDAWLRITKKYKMKYISQAVAFYRFHNSNFSQTKRYELFKDIIVLLQFQKNFAKENNLEVEFLQTMKQFIYMVKDADISFAKFFADMNSIKI